MALTDLALLLLYVGTDLSGHILAAPPSLCDTLPHLGGIGILTTIECLETVVV